MDDDRQNNDIDEGGHGCLVHKRDYLVGVGMIVLKFKQNSDDEPQQSIDGLHDQSGGDVE